MAPRSIPSPPSPEALAPLIGRRAELASLQRLLDEARLVTLLGPGGMGKTRLALALVQQLEERRGTPALACTWVSVSGCTDALSVATRVAQRLSLDVSDAEGELLVDLVGAHLARRDPTLLVLDNFEDAADSAADTVGCWLTRAPCLRILVTSRERLRLALETVVELEPLPIDEGSGGDALLLLLERARAVGVKDLLDTRGASQDERRALMVRILEKLDGIPLAIELAAAQLRVLSPAQLLSRLDDRRALFISDRRDSDPRHRSLHAAIDGSYAALTSLEQEIFTRCSVFPGAFRLEAAEAILLPGRAHEVVDALRRLTDTSLVRRLSGNEARFAMFQTVRAYARQRCAPHALCEVEARFVRWYASGDFLDVDAGAIGSTPSWDEVDRLALEETNLTIAFERALDGGELTEEGAAIALHLLRLYALRGPSWSAAHVLERCLSVPGSRCSSERIAQILLARARHALVFDPVSEAAADLERAIDLHPAASEWPRFWSTRALHARREGDGDAADAHYQHAARFACSDSHRAELGEILAGHAALAFERGQTPRARALFIEALGHIPSRNRAVRGMALTNLALVAEADGDFAFAEQARREAIELHRATSNHRFEGITLGDLGGSALLEGRPLAAVDFYEQALACLKTVGDPPHEALLTGAHAAACALLGRSPGGADGSLDEATAPRVDDGLALAGALYRGVSALAHAMAAPDDGEREAGRQALAAALEAAQRSPSCAASDELRLALAIAQAALEGARREREALFIRREPPGFSLGWRPLQDLAARPLLARLLFALVDARLRRRQGGLSRDELIAAGWPDEKIRPDAAHNRLYVTLSKLRKLGLSDIILHTDEQYGLRADVPLWFIRA